MDEQQRTGLPLRMLARNTISLIGTAIAAVALANIVFLFLMDILSHTPNPYVGILAYIVMPAVLIFGLALIVFGIWRQRRRAHLAAPGEVPRYPVLDFNNPKQRARIAAAVSFFLVFAFLSAVGSYRAFEYSESVEFCGTVCHTVMKPEYTAYLNSPHARVTCVECHVGSGAGWYVRSKLSGAYQVYAASFNKFPRPIPTPVANLRPAQGTCEQCHWPSKFHGAQMWINTHFGYDEANTSRQFRMLVKTGGGDPATGVASGIHWHMNIGNEVSYIATDDKRQVIPWVQVKDKQTGATRVYMARDANLTPEQIAQAPKRVMDCIDCHNRPSHIYVPPDRAVDQALLANRLDPKLPFIKQQAVTALSGDYATTQAGLDGIAKSLTEFYSARGDVDRAKVDATVREVQRIYANNFFPEMKTDWRTHNNNIGHFYYPGCFRCHDDNHVSQEGKAISRDCSICHTILGQEEGPGAPLGAVSGLEFKHPVDIGNIRAMNCTDCHTGAAMQ